MEIGGGKIRERHGVADIVVTEMGGIFRYLDI